jgi:hypothetical protein
LNENSPETERAWAYVHGELGEEERKSFASKLLADGRLRDEVSRLQALDGGLRRWMPLLGLTPDQVENRIIEALEPVLQGLPRQARAPARRLLFPRIAWEWRWPRFQTVTAGLAAIAAILIAALVLPARMAGPIRWLPPTLEPIRYRGAIRGPRLTPGMVGDLDRALAQALGAAYRASGTASAPQRLRWPLATEFRELPEGHFMVRVSALDRHREPVRVWSESWATPESARAGLGDWAGHIAADLRDMERARAAQ